MVRPKREQQIDLQQAIKDTAWQQIAANGAAALSLRAIARELHITAPAIYNYYPRRDDLVTALIIDAYTSLGESQSAAIVDLPASEHAGRLRTAGLAYRQWGITYPQRYQLIFGTPIPGYDAPAEQTMPAAACALRPLIEVLDAAGVDGNLQAEPAPVISAQLRQRLAAWSKIQPVRDEYALYLALVIWSRVHGMVMLETGNQYPSFITDPGEVFHREVELIVQQYLKA